MTKKPDIQQIRKRLWFRSHNRGQRELDILFARFAEQTLPELQPEYFDQYQNLLDTPNTQILNWILGLAPIPQNASPLLRQFLYMSQQPNTTSKL